MILLTGANGFVGGHVVHALRADDRPVRALVRDRRKGGERLEAWGFEVVEGDLTKPERLAAAPQAATRSSTSSRSGRASRSSSSGSWSTERGASSQQRTRRASGASST